MLPLVRTFAAASAARLGMALFGLTALSIPATVFAAPPGFQALPGHIPAEAAQAQPVAAVENAQPVALALALPLHHQAELQDLLRGLSDPSDPRYGQFLTPEEFAARYSPTPAEYARVIAYAQAMGLSVTGTYANRTLLDVAAPAGQVGKAFGLHLLVYRSSVDGRIFFAPDAEPQVPTALAGLVSGVLGLSNASVRQPHLRPKPFPVISPALDSSAAPLETGSGPGGGLTPSDIKTAYNLSSVTQNGSGQTLGLFELDGYSASDVASYETHFGLPNVPLQNVLVDSATGVPSNTSGPTEVTLDIELMTALAPGASGILVYEGPNTDLGVIHTYNKIASDNLAKEVSTSWGEPESEASSTRSSENTAFQQMAAQGQSIYAAAGDSGAYDDRSTLSVDDPASQPYMVGVGGTALTTSGAGGAYKSETTWNNSLGGGGGGISTAWTIPSYQSGVAGSAASKGSATQRNVPDVSLDADPNTGYSIFYGGQWTIYGGTSCAAPLWAAFTSLVNQKRTAAGSSLLGFADPPIYSLAATSAYANDFHDIADGSNNEYYPAVTGYDDATGLGTFNGASLLAALSGAAPAPPAAPTNLTATAGSDQIALSWTGSAGATSYNLYRGMSTGTETLYKSGLTTTGFTDTGLTGGTAYFYQVAAVSSAGAGGKSGEATATPSAVTVVQINAGGGAAGGFTADTDVSGGSTYATGAAINTSGVTNPAPQAVYQTERYGNFTYTLPNLTPGASYTLRLHFAEIYWSSSGQRVFNVSVNGTQALTNFDIFAAAGGKNKAVIKSIPVTADAGGKITVVFTTVKDNAKLSGLELLH